MSLDAADYDSLGSDIGKHLQETRASMMISSSVARAELFDEILNQLSMCDLFSNTALGEPTIFPVYAHKNKAMGAAHDTCVHDLISWLQKIKAGILSDKSPLRPLTSDQEDTSALRNIIANQIRLLPPGDSAGTDEATACIDKVMVCGSEVLERYCTMPYASQYITQVLNICTSHDRKSLVTLKSRLEDFVHGETGKDGFHHVLTEIAFLQVRRSRRPYRHGMIPVALDGAHHIPYLSIFGDSDITFKLKATTAAAKHALFFQLLEQLFMQHNALVNDFKNCYNEIVEDLKLDKQNHLQRNNFHDCMNSNMTKMYHKHWSTFSTAMRNGKFNEYAGILGKHVIGMLDQKKTQEQRAILQWVSPMAAPPMPGKYQDGRAKRLDGTCDWLLKDENFVKWYECKTSTILSLQGSMGMGKTHATSRVIEWIERSLRESQQSKTLAYFYCIEQDEMRSTALAIMRSIVRQVATGPTEVVCLDEAIVKMWNKHGPNNQRDDTSTFDMWEECLIKLIGNYHCVMIVLDALDECKPAQRADLTKLFTSLAKRCSNLKIFVSTRPESDLSRWLGEQESISMHNGHTSGDIAAFVRDKIAQHNEWPYISDQLKNSVLKTIVEKSQGLFLCAHLQIENLQECTYEEDIQDGLRTLPQKLTELYEKLYVRAVVKPAEKKFRDRALRWVLCSLRPLTSDELLYAISQDAQADRLTPLRRDVSERLLLKSCHNFLSLDSECGRTSNWEIAGRDQGVRTPVWRLAHQAVAEFFENSASCRDERANMHYEAGKVCLMIVVKTFSGFAHQSRKRDDHRCPCGAGCGLAKRHNRLQEPLVEYAIHAWPTHVRTIENKDTRESHENSSLSGMLLQLLNDPQVGCLIYERWLQHAIHDGMIQPWSAVYQRKLHGMIGDKMMSPISFVCYMGFPTTLTELLKTAGLENTTHYDAARWTPWPNPPHYGLDERPMRWSALALACVHNEEKVLHCLLNSESTTKLDIFVANESEVPPIVVAAIGNSAGVARELLRPCHGLSIYSAFTHRYGNVVRLAIRNNSLLVLPLLMDRVLLDSSTLKENPTSLKTILSSVRRRDYRSKDVLSLFIEKGVEVNTPLQDGTLLAVAVEMGDEGLVAELLNNDADANLQFRCLEIDEGWSIRNALEACLWNCRKATRASIARLLLRHGASVSAQAVAMLADQIHDPCGPTQSASQTHRQEDPRDLLHLLFASISEQKTTCKEGNEAFNWALNEALRTSDIAGVKLLLDRGADPDLLKETNLGQITSTVFLETLHREIENPYPTLQMVQLLENSGVNFGNLEVYRLSLNTALAAAAWAGLSTLVPILLDFGADPIGSLPDCRFVTALGAAVASGQPEAPDIIRMLADSADFNLCLPRQRFSLSFTRARTLPLDLPLWLMLDKENNSKFQDPSHDECLRNWARSASALVSSGAVWDVDFAQWRECLKQVEPEFALQEAGVLDSIQEGLKINRNGLNGSQKASDEWRIKNPLTAESIPPGQTKPLSGGARMVLATMKTIMLGH